MPMKGCSVRGNAYRSTDLGEDFAQACNREIQNTNGVSRVVVCGKHITHTSPGAKSFGASLERKSKVPEIVIREAYGISDKG
jgi:hypothetical protein